MAERSDQPIETIAGRAGLVTEIHPIKLGGDPLDNTAHTHVRRINLHGDRLGPPEMRYSA